MEYDLQARQKFVDRMSGAIRLGLGPAKLQEVVELAARQHPGITSGNAQLWIVCAIKDDDIIPDSAGSKGIAVIIQGAPRDSAVVIPIDATTFTVTQLAALSVIYQMMDPYFSID